MAGTADRAVPGLRGAELKSDPDLYLVAAGEGTLPAAFRLAERLRDERPGLRLEVNLGGGSFKAQMKRADKSGARLALLLGETELAEERIGLKPLRGDGEQESVTWQALPAALDQLLQ